MATVSSRDQAKSKRKMLITEKSRGLGDTIAKITTAVGIKPCGGCQERQKILNNLVPYKKEKP